MSAMSHYGPLRSTWHLTPLLQRTGSHKWTTTLQWKGCHSLKGRPITLTPLQTATTRVKCRWYCTLRHASTLAWGDPQASQYDPLGFIPPITTRTHLRYLKAGQQMVWQDWTPVSETSGQLPWSQSPQIPALLCADKPTASTELHIFRNMLERAYGSEAYLRTVDDQLGLNLNWMSPIHFLPIFL